MCAEEHQKLMGEKNTDLIKLTDVAHHKLCQAGFKIELKDLILGSIRQQVNNFVLENNTSPHVSACFPTLSLFSHSCVSNCLMVSHGFLNNLPIVEIRAKKRMEPGEILNISYLNSLSLTLSPYVFRQEYLQTKYFTCHCLRCEQDQMKDNFSLPCPTCTIKTSLDICPKCSKETNFTTNDDTMRNLINYNNARARSDSLHILKDRTHDDYYFLLFSIYEFCISEIAYFEGNVPNLKSTRFENFSFWCNYIQKKFYFYIHNYEFPLYLYLAIVSYACAICHFHKEEIEECSTRVTEGLNLLRIYFPHSDWIIHCSQLLHEVNRRRETN